MKPANAPTGPAEVLERLRGRIGETRTEHLATTVAALPDEIDRERVYVVLSEVVFDRAAQSVLGDAERWRKVDGALDAVGRSIDNAADVLRQQMGLNSEQVEALVAGLRREHGELAQHYPPGGSPRVWLGLAGARGGRPATTSGAVRELRALGLSADAARDLLKIVSPTE